MPVIEPNSSVLPAMCMNTSPKERTPSIGRQENLSSGTSLATARASRAPKSKAASISWRKGDNAGGVEEGLAAFCWADASRVEAMTRNASNFGLRMPVLYHAKEYLGHSN